jgi:hypothetical protein
MGDTKGLILDLRWNGGGAEPLGREIVGRFLDRPRVYSCHQLRCGPKHTDLAPKRERQCVPAGPWYYTGPVAVLQGRKTMSSAVGVGRESQVRLRRRQDVRGHQVLRHCDNDPIAAMDHEHETWGKRGQHHSRADGRREERSVWFDARVAGRTLDGGRALRRSVRGLIEEQDDGTR